MYQMKSADAQVTGNLFSLPAGDVSAGCRRRLPQGIPERPVDPLIDTTFTNSGGRSHLNCDGPGSICSSPAQGGFNVKEAYAELLVPILKDEPFAHSLNLSLGDRYSKYSNFGSTNNWKVALEYRPIEDLLLRGTVAKVFRAPSPTDLFSGPGADAPTATDPCAGNPGAASNPACQGFKVPPEAERQLQRLYHGLAIRERGSRPGIDLNAGKRQVVLDYGFVYDPRWLPGLSINADYYRILLDNLIVSGSGIAQTILNPMLQQRRRNLLRHLSQHRTARSNTSSKRHSIPESRRSRSHFGVHYRMPETAYGRSVSGSTEPTSRTGISTKADSRNTWPGISTRRSAIFHACA